MAQSTAVYKICCTNCENTFSTLETQERVMIECEVAAT